MIHLILLQNRIEGIGEVLEKLFAMKTEFLFLHMFRTHPQLTADGIGGS